MSQSNRRRFIAAVTVALLVLPTGAWAQGVTTAGLTGIISSDIGEVLAGANIELVHEPSQTHYGAIGRAGGYYNLLNLKVGGPYTLTVSFIGYQTEIQTDIFLTLGSSASIDVSMEEEVIVGEAVEVVAELDEVFNADRTGAATYVGPTQLARMPSIKRSTRDLTRLDPRSDGNFSFGGRNWLYNNISLDGSYFNNPFGLDDPAPGGQTNAEPVPFDAIEQVQVSVAPFDVREGGFTGAGINTVTKSGTNQLSASVYTYTRSEAFVGNKVSGDTVLADPSLSFNQSGISIGGPIIRDKLFFFLNAEIENRTDPGSNFVADATGGGLALGESRVNPDTMDAIRARMMDVYEYDTGSYQDYFHDTKNEKLLAKLDWNISNNHNLTFRYSYLNASRDLPPHGFVLSYKNSGRGPNSESLPFYNSGYTINNKLNSYALQVNSIFGGSLANRFFFSYNQFRDFRNPFSVDYPTIQIGQDGVTYATLGHEPFSIHNILDQDVIQITNNVSYFMGKHAFTVGFNYERFKFFNSFNIFRHFFFGLDFTTGLTTFDSVADFFAATDPALPDAERANFEAFVGSGPFKGELIEVGQISIYGQDELRLTDRLNLIAGLRIDIPQYITQPVANPYSTGLTLLDENDETETIDQAKFPDATPLYSPRIGFNLDVTGDRSLQLRGGTGIFTGRLPFVWIGNVISNPGFNPNLYDPNVGGAIDSGHETDDGAGREGDLEGTQSILQVSFDLNAMDPDFKWPQVWTTDLAVDIQLPGDMLGTFELVYGKDINAIYMRNADLVKPVRTLADGRPYFGGIGYDAAIDDFNSLFELNQIFPFEFAGVYVIDNTDEGYSLTLTAQLRKSFANGLETSVAYTFLDAKNNLRSTEIASVLWTSQPVQGDPNNPKLSFSEFGNRHRFIAAANYSYDWNPRMATSVGLFFELAQGNRYIYNGGNRYSFIYSGDVNGDGYGGNDLIYIPENESDINLADASDWEPLNAFIDQDDYLSANRGKIAERFGAINPWFSNLDLRITQDISAPVMGKLQISLDILNLGNLIDSNWGVRQIASASALSPLTLDSFDSNGEPVFNFTGPAATFIDDPSVFSRWQIQLGVRYSF